MSSGGNVSIWALRNRALALFFMLAIVVTGVAAFLGLGRDEDPPFTIRTMVVQAAWPGASIEDTLKQVTERLERTLQETPNLDRLESYTRAGVAVIFVNLDGSTGEQAVVDTWYTIRKRIGDMRHTLPQGVVGPGFDDEFGDTFGVIYGFTADGFSHRELRDAVEDIRSELLLVQDVEQIELLGAQDETVFVEYDPRVLANLGVAPSTLVAALSAQNVVRPAGVLRSSDENVALQVTGAFGSEADLRDVTFQIGDRRLRLEDVATVRRGLPDPPQPLFHVNGEPAIGLAVSMQEGGDVIALGENLRARMAQLVADLPIGIEPILVADQPATVDAAIGDFTESLWQAIAIVLAISFIALGVRAGLVVTFAIPLTLAAVFVTMQTVGIDLQRISLGALIIALALLVDDAMTTVDAMIRRLAAGDPMEKAGGYAYEKLAFAMLTGALVTIAGFVPIGFAQSSAGEYTFSIFAVVGIALIASWIVAVTFAPVIGAALLKPPAAGTVQKEGGLLRGYRAALGAAIRFRWITIGVTIGLFALSVVGLGSVQRQFFPPSDRVELLIDLTLPRNASIHRTREAAERLEVELARMEGIERWSTYVGRGAIRFYLPLDVQLPNDFFAQLVLVTDGIEDRERLQDELETLLAEAFPEVTGRVYPLELGPPVGWPVQYRVTGPDPVQVRAIARDLAQVVAAGGDTQRVNFDWMEPARELRVVVDQDEARRLGLSAAAVAQAIDAAVTGVSVTQIRDDIYLIPVVVRAAGGQTLSPSSLSTLEIATPSGRSVALSQLARLEPMLTDPLIWRRDRVPTLTVQADLAPGVLPDAVVARLAPAIAAFAADLPLGYAVATGGSVEESAKSQASVFAVVPVMLMLVLVLLMVQLRCFQRLFLVLAVVPLGLIGVVGALLASGQPLGFVAILGVLALVGMIAKNAVILIESIEDERRNGLAVREAVIEASASRLRPILLTALSTVLGMIPIAFTVFWGAMAFAVMGGLAVASALTLLFLPTLYVTWFERAEAGGAQRERTSPETPATASSPSTQPDMVSR
jgi:multidrug efflux pump subunit AcrB